MRRGGGKWEENVTRYMESHGRCFNLNPTCIYIVCIYIVATGLYVNVNFYLFVLLFGNNFLFLSIRTLNSSPPLFVPSRKKIITTKDDERSALINPLLPRSTVIPVGNKDSRSWINATIPFAVCTRAPLHLQRLARTFIGYENVYVYYIQRSSKLRIN